MTVYVDTAFAVNSAVNYLLLLTAARLAGAPFRQRRLWLAAAFGGLYAAAVFFPGFAFLRSGWIKAVVLTVMVLTAFGAQRRTVKLALLFAAAGAALAGAAMLAVQFLHLSILLLPGGVFYPLSARALLLLAAAGCGICQLVFSCLIRHSGQLFPITLRLGSRTASLSALLDTGNTLRDPLTNEPVLVADSKLAARLLPEAALQPDALADPAGLFPILSQRYPELRFRLIPYRAVGTASGLLLAVRCAVSAAGRKETPRLVAFSPTPVSQSGEFEILTGGSL